MPAGEVVGYDDPVAYDAAVSYSLPANATTLRLYDALGPAMRAGDADNGFTLLRWIDGPAVLLGDVDDLVRDTNELPGWAGLFTAPPPAAAGWVEQVTGGGAQSRGTVDAIAAAVRATLTGSGEVDLDERTDGQNSTDRPYRFTVRTLASQTPDPAATARALAAATPAGLLSTLLVVEGGRAGYLDGYTDTYA